MSNLSKHQTFKDTIKAYKPEVADTPVLYSTTEANRNVFKALIGRELKLQSLPAGIIIFIIILAAVTIINISWGAQSGTPVVITYVPIFMSLYLYRTTLISIGKESLEFYCLRSKFGSKYEIYDSFDMTYNKIESVKIKSGSFNTTVTLEFANDNKKFKIRFTAPNKMKKMEEQAENLKYLLDLFERKNINNGQSNQIKS